jgi:large subunit ribosomal protein L23
MPILDFLKNKKEKDSSKKTEKVLNTKKEKPAVVLAPVTVATKGFSYEAVKQPHISEKATYLAEDGQYVFVVDSRSNKQEIKKSIEGIYGVNVLSVNLIKIPAKKRRLGRTEGFRKGYKKAIVTIKEGQKIEII